MMIKEKLQKRIFANGKKSDFDSGFTMVELIVVIAIIGILAAITIVSYLGITSKATASALQSDLNNASKQLKLYHALYDSYPTTMIDNCPTAPNNDTDYCIKSSPGNTMVYDSITPQTFHLKSSKGDTSYSITDTTSPSIATTASNSSIGSACTTGFIPVPGSGTYGTNDFCVMKYEAKNDGSNIPISTAAGLPWVSISQTDAIVKAPLTADCKDCHLITEAEWLTVAQNVLSVPSNWSTGVVGSGYIYRGHTDNAPANALEADTNDTNGYYGTGQTTGEQRRTLTLTNGEVIWDMAGNVYDWTAGQTTGGQPGITSGGWAWREYTNLTNIGTITPNIFPAATGLAGSNTWTATNYIGRIYSNADEVGLRGFLRGGNWGISSNAGVLVLNLGYSPGYTNTSIGFRVAGS